MAKLYFYMIKRKKNIKIKYIAKVPSNKEEAEECEARITHAFSILFEAVAEDIKKGREII